MDLRNSDLDLLSDPADARRHQTGDGGVKCATGHVIVSNQAIHGKYVTDKPKSVRQPHRLGTWNVRGLNQPGKLQIIESEMKRKGVNILGLSETHWRNSGYFSTDQSNKVYFSGPENESSKGVAFVVPLSIDKYVSGYKPINERIIAIKVNTTPCKLNIIQVYAPTAQSSEDEIENFYSALAKSLHEIPQREITVVLGDFNAKIGQTDSDEHLRRVVGKYGIGNRNERGERMLQFCSEENLTVTNTCFKQHIRRLYTWISPGDRCRNQIDYILIRNRWKSSVLNTTTYPGADCGSDHQLLVTTVRLRLRKLHKQERTLNMRHVDPQAFRKAIEHKLPNCSLNDTTDPDVTWKALQKIIVQTAKENMLPKPVMKPYMSTETADLILRRRELKGKGLTSHDNRRLYDQLSTEVQKRCRKDYDQHINNVCADLEQNSAKHETRDLFRKVKELTKSRNTRTCTIADEAGNVLTEKDQVLERWKQYCTTLYDTGHPMTSGAQTDTLSPQEPEILQSEVEHALGCLKDRKAPGKDGIPAELLKNLDSKGVKQILSICNSIWKTRRWPEEWTESVFVPLHKKGSTKDCSNYRTLALIPHVSKILLYIINNRLKHFLNPQIPEEQAGFVKGKGTREQILNVRQIIEKSREFNSPVLMCFIDYTKAFDCVQWDKLWEVLKDMGTPQHLIDLVRSLYINNRSFVKIDTDCSNVFSIKKGVRQGCILSPLLFNVYGEYIIRKTLEGWEKGFAVGGKRISNLRYADDTVLLATTFDDMKEILHRLEVESGKLGLAINRQKTKLMVIDRAGKLSGVCNIQGIDTVDSFIYLGSNINNEGSCVPEIKRRIAMAKDVMTRLQNIWKNRSISYKTKARLVRALVYPIFLYGVETWTIRARERQRIDAFEMWCWRRMLRIPWTAKRTNVSVLSQLDVKTRLSTICLQRILTYFGHIMRRGDSSLEKLVIVGNTEGKRARGRSPTRWSDQVKEATSSSNFQQVVMATLDRSRWRQIVRLKGSSDHDPQ